jgi:hypothetical protein
MSSPKNFLKIWRQNFTATFGSHFYFAEIRRLTISVEYRMALATFSPEAKIKNGLRELNCAESNFANFAGVVGRTRLMEGLAGQKDFERHDAERMLQVLEEMRELQSEIDVPIDWSRVDKISTALAIRRVAKIAAELNDDSMNAKAAEATREVFNVPRPA